MKDAQLQRLEHLSELLFRNDLTSFITKCFATTNPGTVYLHNWHIDLISEYLQACEKGQITRLIINIPPRYLKSLIINVAWPCWLLGRNPSRRIISASYSQALATKHSIDSRLILNSAWYQKIFPATRIVNDQNEKDKFITTQRGFRLATSVGGTLTGEGGNFLILDDPHNPAHIFSTNVREQVINWYEQVFLSRLDDKNKGVIVLIMQRLHPEDISGYLLAKNTNWNHLCIPAIAKKHIFFPSPLNKSKGYLFPEKFPLHPFKESLKNLKDIESESGAFAFNAQYMQNPLPAEGGLINKNWLKRYRILPENFNATYQSWDTAIKAGMNNDHTVCTTWGELENCYYLIDILKGKFEYPELKRKMISHYEKYLPSAVLVEDKASGQSLIQDIKLETRIPILPVMPKNDKLTRLAAVTPMLESGKVLFPYIASWLNDMETELLSFPSSPHDDQVDSISQFLNWARNKAALKPNIRRL